MKAFDKASLALVPDGIKDGKLYSIKPTDGSGDFTFSRGSNLTATRVDENGLIEKGRENIVLQSNNFDEIWGQSSLNATSGQAGYDGTTDAWSISKTAQFGRLQQTVTLAGLTTMSVYAKASTNDWIAMRHSADGSSIANFDLTNGVFGAIGSNVVATNSVSIGNGWYRISVTWNYTGSSEIRIHPNASDSIGGTTATIFIQDVQVEQGLVATDYIETGATTVQAGILEDLPRIDYTGGTPSLLLETSGTNLITQSEYLNGHSKNSSTLVNFSNTTCPIEGVRVSQIIDSNSGGNGRLALFQSISLTASTTYTASIFAKADQLNFIYFSFDGAATSSDKRVWFNLSTGQVGTESGGATGSIESFGNGWYRCIMVFTADNTGVVNTKVAPAETDNNINVDRDGSSSVFATAMQLEQGSYPTSYIPTYGASATRGGDSILPKIINPTSNNTFTVFFELHLDNMPLVSNEQFLNLIDSANTVYQSFRMFNRNGEHIMVPYFNVDTTYAFSTNIEANRSDTGKVVFRANGDGSYDMFIRFEGTTTKRSSSGLTAYNLGRISFPLQTSINIKSFLAFDDPLSDAECIRLTTENLTLTKPAFVGGAGLNNFVVAVSGDIAGGSGTIETNWQWQISNDGNTWSDISGATNDYYTIPNDTNLLGKYIRVEQSINDEYGTFTVVASDGQQILQLAGLFDSVAGTAGYSLNRLRSSTPFAAAARVTRDGTHFTTIGFTSDDLFDSAAAMAYATQTGNIVQHVFDQEFDTNTFNSYGGEIDVLATPFRGEENVLVYEVANDAIDAQRFFTEAVLDPTLGHTIRFQAKIFIPSNQKVDKVRIWTGYGIDGFIDVTTTDTWVDVNQTLLIATGVQARLQAYNDTNLSFNAPGDKFYIKDLTITDTTPNLHVQTLYDQSGNNNHAVQNAFQSMPMIIEDGVLVEENGNPALKFDGVDDYFDTNLGTLTESSVFMLFRKTGNGSNSVFGGTGNRSLGYTRENLRHRVFYVNWGAENITDSRTPPFTELVSFFRSETATTVDLFRDGVNKASLTSLGNTLTNPTNLIGLLGGSNSYYFEGLIQELIFFDSADQSKIREGIERVMANRYNIDLS